ncbi:hypothetical protein LJC20_03535 [Eubacteriales bacterium OttesenSCG-928-M02]|nr:hypothetical protein [Eubacteriales bacterium OttesenSCG-928-M02]
MNFSNFTIGLSHPFRLDENAAIRTCILSILAFFLGTVCSIPLMEGLRASLLDVVLYLAIATLPMGWAFVSSAGISALCLFFYGQWQYGVITLIVKGVAVVVAKGLYTAAIPSGRQKLYIPLFWCFITLLAGYFIFDIIIYGVMNAFVFLAIRGLEWICSMLLALSLLSLPEYIKIKRLNAFFRLMGWME